MKPVRILIVDDEPEVRETIAEALGRGGYEVAEAASAREAVTIMGRRPADVILLDIAMPEADGVHALRTLSAFHAGVPIIMLTANVDAQVARDTLRMGAFDYIAKPCDLEHLRNVVTAATARSAMRDAGQAKRNERFKSRYYKTDSQ